MTAAQATLPWSSICEANGGIYHLHLSVTEVSYIRAEILKVTNRTTFEVIKKITRKITRTKLVTITVQG